MPATQPNSFEAMIDIIIIARQTSTRLPGKTFLNIMNKPSLEYLFEKIKDFAPNIIFAIPNNDENNQLYDMIKSFQCRCYRGSESNVLKRFSEAARICSESYVQRLNADNVMIDANYIKKCHDFVTKDKGRHSLYSNLHCKNHSGQSIEIVRREIALDLTGATDHDKEHVFPFFYKQPLILKKIPCPNKTVRPLDTAEDLKFINAKSQ